MPISLLVLSRVGALPECGVIHRARGVIVIRHFILFDFLFSSFFVQSSDSECYEGWAGFISKRHGSPTVLQSLQIGAVFMSIRQSTSVQAVVRMVLVVVTRESTFFFCSLTLCLSLFQSLSGQSDSWDKGCRADFAQKGHGTPLLLHVLQVDIIVVLVVVFILGLAVVGVALVVVATVALAEGNGAHRFAGLFALGGVNLLMSSLLVLYFSFLWGLS